MSLHGRSERGRPEKDGLRDSLSQGPVAFWETLLEDPIGPADFWSGSERAARNFPRSAGSEVVTDWPSPSPLHAICAFLGLGRQAG